MNNYKKNIYFNSNKRIDSAFLRTYFRDNFFFESLPQVLQIDRRKISKRENMAVHTAIIVSSLFATLATKIVTICLVLFLSTSAIAQEPYIGEIRIFAGDFAPRHWAFCEGQLLPISQYSALFSIIGRTYGGNVSHFALPDLRGRVPIHFGQGNGLTNRTLGEKIGSEDGSVPTGGTNMAGPGRTGNKVISSSSVGTNDANMQPTLGVHYIIALYGIYPPRN